jgi:DNA-binding transcriptional LysR family regulator
MLLDIRQIEYVVALNRFRNYGRAAESLGISPAALSKGISGLERILEVRAFERGRGAVTATAFGAFLAERGGAIVQNMDGLLRELHRMKGLESGTLDIGAGPFPLEISVAESAARLASRHPGVQIRLRGLEWTALAPAVLEGRLDVAVGELAQAEQEPLLSVERLGVHPLSFFCRKGHPLEARRDATLKEIVRFPLAMTPIPSRAARLFAQVNAAGAVDPVTGNFLPSFSVNSVRHMMQFVLATDAVGMATEKLLAPEIAAGRVVALRFAAPWLRLNYGLVTLRGRAPTPILSAFLAEMRSLEFGLAPGEAHRREPVTVERRRDLPPPARPRGARRGPAPRRSPT